MKRKHWGRPARVTMPRVTEVTLPARVVPPAAATLLRLVESKGMVNQLFVTDAAVVVVEAYDRERGVALRAMWQYGRTLGATWYSRTTRWGTVPAEREKLQGTGSNRAVKPTGYVDGTRTVLLEGPAGVAVGITEVNARVRALS